MKLALALLCAVAVYAQPALNTELRNGVVRAIVLHATGDPVTDESPAVPGEVLFAQGTSLTEAQLLGNRLAVFGRVGARPFKLEEMQRLFQHKDGTPYTVTNGRPQ